jgi:2-iminobutanoate/2-iminopropanoate deaminase
MTKATIAIALLLALLLSNAGMAEELEYLGKPVPGIPFSPVVKAGKLIFISGTAGFKDGKIAAGDFATQMTQAMENITTVLKSVGAGWDRVAKTNVMLVRGGDYDAMNRIYKNYFPDERYPARTTIIVAGLPNPDLLLEIECEAFLK